MSKAILVMDMPKTCNECKLANEDYDVCQATQKSISYNERGYGIQCPLKPLPEKKHNNGGYRVIDGTEWFYDSEHDDGWNDCLDEILRGEE